MLLNISIKFVLFIVFIFSIFPFTSGCCSINERTNIDNSPRFTRVFCWAVVPSNEEVAKKYAQAGVTDIPVRTKKQCELAIKYGMTPYYSCFSPAGPHFQVVTPEEEQYRIYISGKDLDKKLSKEERNKIIHQRRLEKKHRYGGAKDVALDVLSMDIRCFISDTDFSYTRKKLDDILVKAVPGVKGIFFDYIGYINHQGCYCKGCLAKLKAYLKKNNLTDSETSRNNFYKNELIKYYNKAAEYVKSKRPEFKIVAHLYPDFHPDPLYGNRLKIDYCGQTVAWYFKWNPEKIDKYTRYVLTYAKKYYSFVEGIPFLGINSSKATSLGYKSPADLEKELKIILAGNSRTLMICNGNVMIQEGYFDVFKKYCGPKKLEEK